ncbi:MAG: LysR substrate-binding domain-containing protein [Solirubrobacteraceae bacterium]
MELRHLEAFVAVADELHFSRAAERLQIAQSPLSQRIRTLEAELGVRLFERTNRRVRLTQAGVRILVEARATLRAADATARAAQRTREGEAGLLRLGFVASAAFLRLPELLRVLRQAVPAAEVELLRLNSSDQLDALAEDRIDAGLARVAPVGDVGWEVGVAALEPEPYLAVVAREHPLAGRRWLALGALADELWILSGSASRSELVRGIHRMCARAGFTPRVAHEAPDLPSVMAPVAGGLGVSLVPLGIAQLKVPGVAAIPLRSEDQSPLPTTLVWHAPRASPLVRRLVTAVTQRA